MNKWLKWPVLDICLGEVCVLDAHVQDSCVQDVCVSNALCPTAGCFTMTCHCLRWLCARCLSYGCISGVSVLYVCVYNVCLQDIYPRCLCIRWPCDWCGCAASLCILMPKFEMSVSRMSVIQCLFGEWLCGFNILLWWDHLSSMPLCGISVWRMTEFSSCVSRISAPDECLLDNCLKNVRVLNA